MKKVFALALLFIICASGQAFALFDDAYGNYAAPAYVFKEGLSIELIGSYVNDEDGNVYTLFLAKSDKDMTLDVTASALFDDRGGRFTLGSTSGGNNWGVRMAGYRTHNITMIAEVPIIVLFAYAAEYEEYSRKPENLRTVAKMKFLFNNHELEFNNIRLQSWKSCLDKMQFMGYTKQEWWERR